MTNAGDKSLNQVLPFTVYTRRWGYTDTYKISRTVDGWYCSYNAINGNCEIDGTGALLDNLHHDYVFFPEEGVKSAMETLWRAADEGEIDLSELGVRLQQVADWISAVEKSIYKQPAWVKYY